MSVQNISFGKVIGVCGKPKKVDRLYNMILPDAEAGKVMIKDVTQAYRYTPGNGCIASCVQRDGGKIDIFITGSDIEKIQNREKGWTSIKEILTHLSSLCDLREMSVYKAAKTIKENE